MSSTTQKVKFFIKNFFSKCGQILDGKLHLLSNVGFERLWDLRSIIHTTIWQRGMLMLACFQRIWSHLLKKSLMENFIFCVKLFIFLTLVRLHKPEMLDEIELICKYGNIQKQPTRGVLRKKCSENMQQIYRRTPMAKCDLLK